jgi:hypothetical protein
MRELIKVWRKSGFTLRLWDTNTRDWRGQSRLAYELKDGRKVIFAGEDFAGSPMHSDDSLETVASLLGFLTCKPGDTDSEYFDKYTEDQMDWCQSFRCEELAMIQYEIEERRSK